MHITYYGLILLLSIILLSSLSLFIYFLLASHKQATFTYDSIILTLKENTHLLTEWLNGKNINKITLLYRRSRDGSKPKDFHTLCDNITNTLTIFKLVNETIIGGYTEATWEGFGFKYDSNSFIFNLSKKMKYAIHKQEHAIFVNQFFLPIFGERDIFYDGSDEVLSAFPRCYGHNSPQNELTSEITNLFLIELEVFKIDYT